MDPALERATLAAEDEHWWYRGRRAIVGDAARRALGDELPAAILDVGCGGGATMAALGGLGTLTGIEPSAASRRQARARDAGEVLDGTVESLPFADASFRLALALDVLEHLDDDLTGLAEIRRVVAPGGGLVVTVPAHPRLWSRHDELNHHRRRYTRSGLAAVASAAGWRVRSLGHFTTLVLPLALAARRLGTDGLSVPPAPLNRALEWTLELERLAIRAGLRAPLGLSLLAELSCD